MSGYYHTFLKDHVHGPKMGESDMAVKPKKGSTGLDRKSAHPLLFNTRKQGH